MSRANDLWFIRFHALVEIAKEAKVVRNFDCGSDKTDKENKQMDAALARIAATIHNEQEDEERLEAQD